MFGKIKNRILEIGLKDRAKLAFTLAEVLIVVGIIGMVAEMTIPTLVTSVKEQSTTTILKETFSILQSAYSGAVAENGDPTTWNLIASGDATGLANLNQIMTTQMKVTKNCGTGQGCFPDLTYKDLNGSTTYTPNIDTITSSTKVILANGVSLRMGIYDPACANAWGTGSDMVTNICGYFQADVNGLAPPNQYGVDLFNFHLSKYGFVPHGAPNEYQDSGHLSSFTKYCNKSQVSTAGAPDGGACGGWVIYRGNLDYLDCNDLSFTGKSKCS